MICFLVSEFVSGAEIHRRLSAQYGNSVLSQWSVYEWIEKLKNSRTNVMNEEGAGSPSMATTDDNIERVRDMVMFDSRLTMDICGSVHPGNISSISFPTRCTFMCNLYFPLALHVSANAIFRSTTVS